MKTNKVIGLVLLVVIIGMYPSDQVHISHDINSI
jgi:hypothetical protein